MDNSSVYAATDDLADARALEACATHELDAATSLAAHAPSDAAHTTLSAARATSSVADTTTDVVRDALCVVRATSLGAAINHRAPGGSRQVSPHGRRRHLNMCAMSA